MSRQARKKSANGVYHIMLRGINGNKIFYTDEDYSRFIETLKKYKEVSGFKLYAYCLMKNHIHLLLKVEKEDLGLIIKRIGASFVYWYNFKYHRMGALFQDRFKSEPVDSDEYFLTVLRYIHQNPVKAGICKDIGDYKYSSYNEYAEAEQGLTDTLFALKIIDRNSFVEFHKQENKDVCLDYNEKSKRISDDDAVKIVLKKAKLKSIDELAELDIESKKSIIKKLKKYDISLRQLSRITGVGIGVIRNL